MEIDENAHYLESHEWVRTEGTEQVAGISWYAQDSLGDVVFVELPKVGQIVEAGKVLAVVESVKAASDVYSPVSGKVIAVNTLLTDDPGLLNREPFKGGWIAKIDGKIELLTLMNAVAYRKFCEGL